MTNRHIYVFLELQLHCLFVCGAVRASQRDLCDTFQKKESEKKNALTYWTIALWAKLLRKWEIGKFNKITSWPLIFWKTLLFQMNLEENVTFTFYFFSFASNFPCKILWDNKNIDANIFIFSNSIFTMKGVRSKKVILRFFLKHKKI